MLNWSQKGSNRGITEVLCGSDMEKDNYFTPARFEQKLFYPTKCVTCDKSEFATKQRKICLTTSMSKIRLPHINRSNNYVIINKKSSCYSNS